MQQNHNSFLSQKKVTDRVTFSMDSFPTKPKNSIKHFLEGEINLWTWRNDATVYKGVVHFLE